LCVRCVVVSPCVLGAGIRVLGMIRTTSFASFSGRVASYRCPWVARDPYDRETFMEKRSLAVVVTIAFSLVGVAGDYLLKRASEAANPMQSRWFYIGFAVYASTAFGWVFVMRHLKLVPQHGNGISRSRDFAYTSPVLDCEAKEVTIAREGGEGQGQREAVGGFAGTQSVAHGGEGDCAACVDLGAGVSGALE
jgi:hypothetical protein